MAVTMLGLIIPIMELFCFRSIYPILQHRANGRFESFLTELRMWLLGQFGGCLTVNNNPKRKFDAIIAL